MDSKRLAPWLGVMALGLLAGYLGRARAVDRAPTTTPITESRVSPLPTPENPGAVTLATIDPEIQAAVMALAITPRVEGPQPSAPIPARPEAPLPQVRPSELVPARPQATIDASADQEALLAPALEQMAERARDWTTRQAEYQKSCTGTTPIPYRDVYGRQMEGTMEKADMPECKKLKEAVSSLGSALKAESAEIQEKARRAGVLPGVMRRLVQRYALEAHIKP